LEHAPPHRFKDFDAPFSIIVNQVPKNIIYIGTSNKKGTWGKLFLI
jgi:hypothetical protein